MEGEQGNFYSAGSNPQTQTLRSFKKFSEQKKVANQQGLMLVSDTPCHTQSFLSAYDFSNDRQENNSQARSKIF